MKKKKSLGLTRANLVKGIGAFALSLLFSTGAAAECENRGNLDARYCDDNGDLVADPPTDPAQWLDPDTLIFSYTPVEDHPSTRTFSPSSWTIWRRRPASA